MKHPMARKRQLDKNKQKRKQKLVRVLWHGADEVLDNPRFVGKLVKGKIHCSCPMCAVKTNSRNKAIDSGWKHSDRQKLEKLSSDILEEYKEAYIELAK